ncbi:MAG: 2-succinyl-5-enolpyruvyl-6-hydroxy-3-cyclohexene-1-carboxylate synthase, partial [Actinomycetota bacterium]
LYGERVRWFFEVGVAEGAGSSAERYWRSVVDQAVDAATGAEPGPVHLNIAFRDPLVPPVIDHRPAQADGHRYTRTVSSRMTVDAKGVEELAATMKAATRPVLVAGYGASAPAIATLADATGWPVLAEAISGARVPGTISCYDAILRVPELADELRPGLVIRFGVASASRALSSLLDGVPEIVIGPYARHRPDPSRTATMIAAGDPLDLVENLMKRLDTHSGDQVSSWDGAEAKARAAIDGWIDREQVLTEPAIARDLCACLPPGSLLAVASSMPLRDVDWFMQPRTAVDLLANRGANGIDGFVSTAVGAASVRTQNTFGLLGDLCMIHDQNGFVGANRTVQSLVIVVVNNDGGGIFSFLPPAQFKSNFEDLFGTPHGFSFSSMAAAAGIGHVEVKARSDLTSAVLQAANDKGIWVIEARTERERNVEVHNELWACVADALR